MNYSLKYLSLTLRYGLQTPGRARQLLAMLSALVLLISLSPIKTDAASGDLDGSYGTGGIVFSDFNGLEAIASRSVMQSDGKVVVVGSVLITSGFNSDFALARFTTTGTLDLSFGNGALVVTDFLGRLDRALACAVLG